MNTEIEKCRICGNPRLEPVLDLGSMTLTGIFPRRRDEVVPAGPLELVKCYEEESRVDRVCGLVQLRHSIDAELMYRQHYGYRSGLNRSMVDHLRGLVERIAGFLQLRPGDLVIDIGSNDATLLKAYPDLDLRLVGIDPTGEKFRQYYTPEIELIPDFFSPESLKALIGERKARIVTSISMFYDLEDPVDFMRQIRDLLADDGIWVFEQSYLPAMMEMNSYDTVCHEHLEFYALRQIEWMTDLIGLKIVDLHFNRINGGSFCVTAARRHAPYPEKRSLIREVVEKEARAGLDGLAPYRDFSERVGRHALELRELIERVRAEGKLLVGYGASTKGNVILQYCGLTEREIPCIAEVNEDKFGAWTPGTRIPIVSESQARAMNPDYFLVLPWHFRESIVERESEFLRRGGALIMPLPRIEVVRG